MSDTNNSSDTEIPLRSPSVVGGEKLLDEGLARVNYSDFDEIIQKAKIPNLSGLSGRVLDILQKRAGEGSLSIEDIAEHMQLSKRTLQRHLQQENIHFGAIRDLVRFNVAIDCLLKKGMSVEETAGYLDFSDRTSFTYAFKRWANMSPSVFRKLYRDYV